MPTMSELLLEDMPLLSGRAYRRLVNVFFSILALTTAAWLWVTVRFYGAWTISDWLINYQGGFVRRGLAGEMLWLIARLFHVHPEMLLIGWLAVLYALLLEFGRRLALRARPSFWRLLTVLSPATFAFHLWDPNGGFRKETMLLVLLLGVLTVEAEKAISSHAAGFLLWLSIPSLVLCHEPLLAFVPYLLTALVLRGVKPRRLVVLAAFPLMVGLAAAGASVHFHGSLRTAEGICASLGRPLMQQQGRDVCQWGAIGYLGFSSATAHQLLLVDLAHFSYWKTYSACLVLAMLPLVLGSIALTRSGRGGAVRLVLSASAVSWVCSLPLFYFAGDWGRWIFIHTFCTAVLLLSIAKNDRVEERWFKRLTPGMSVSLGAYALFWSLPHYLGQVPPFGIIGLMMYLRTHLPLLQPR